MKYLFLLFGLLFFSGCSTLEHDAMGAPYSGFDDDYDVEYNYGPSGAR